ncbi:unnamed protein product [Parnassius mnemosyne]|uniref:Transposase n=2 Tax=Parnassius mnemosyne TaxID=213953 RepID=A0AAV1KFD4_9NEOP
MCEAGTGELQYAIPRAARSVCRWRVNRVNVTAFWREMASSQRNRAISMREIADFLQDDDDSDIEEAQNEEIEDLLSDLQVVVASQERHDDGAVEEEEQFREPVNQRGRTGERTQRRFRRGRQRGGTVRSTTHGRSSQMQITLREMDEANGWTYVPRERPLEDPVFEEVCRVLAPIDKNSSEIDCFSVFFTNDFWKLLKTETNRYAAQMKTKLARRGLLKPGSMLDKWTPVTLEELKLFFSIIIHMSLVHKESFDAYWSTREIIHTPYAAKLMNRDRFRAIYSCLHLNDNSKYIPRGQDNYDAFFKLRPYFDELCRLCATSFYPGESLTIDEGTCGFRGRVHFRVFNKDKPDKYGMKIYMLCDAATGYILNMVPYVGESKTVEQIVTELSEPYFEKWHTIYMDRFFSSPTVADLLWLKNTRVVGTVMPNRRGLPQEWRQQLLEVNEMSFCHRGNLTACKWKDKRDVPFLTTKHAATWTEVTVKAKGGLAKKIKPDCVLDYNKNKIGVDLNDQYVSYYALQRKCMKWWKKMFFHLVARAMVNSMVIYNKQQPARRQLRFSQFLMACGEGIVPARSTDDAGPSHGAHLIAKTSRLVGRHFIERIPSTEKKTKVTRVCKVCADTIKHETGKRGRKETVFYCPDCNVPLCNDPCFKKYHTVKNYHL